MPIDIEPASRDVEVFHLKSQQGEPVALTVEHLLNGETRVGVTVGLARNVDGLNARELGISVSGAGQFVPLTRPFAGRLPELRTSRGSRAAVMVFRFQATDPSDKAVSVDLSLHGKHFPVRLSEKTGAAPRPGASVIPDYVTALLPPRTSTDLPSLTTEFAQLRLRRQNSNQGERQYRLVADVQQVLHLGSRLLPALTHAVQSGGHWSEDSVKVVWGDSFYTVRRVSYYPQLRELSINVNKRTPLRRFAERWEREGMRNILIPARFIITSELRLSRIDLMFDSERPPRSNRVRVG